MSCLTFLVLFLLGAAVELMFYHGTVNTQITFSTIISNLLMSGFLDGVIVFHMSVSF
jgi:hypothetical protein